MDMEIKYVIREINPDVHRSGQYLIDNHDGVYLSGGRCLPEIFTFLTVRRMLWTTLSDTFSRGMWR
jgi:hypothetical protein